MELVAQAAVEEPGDTEEQRHQEGEFGVRRGVKSYVYHTVDGPGDTTDEPYPGGLPHRVLDAE